jgi:hemerythrin-like domain-containing protein
MKPTEELILEHKAIKMMLGIMGKIAENMQNEKDVEINDVKEIVNFLKTFADKCHHGKEENVLFPALLATGIPSENGPIGVMLYEHTQGRAYIQAMHDGAENWENHDAALAQSIANAMLNYSTLMQNHILKEENVLFVLADQRLSAPKQEEILAKFEQIEEEVVGHGIHEKFHELLNQLKAKYID